MVGDLEYLVDDADRWRSREILAHDVNFLNADRQTKFLASIGEPVDQMFKAFFDQGARSEPRHRQTTFL